MRYLNLHDRKATQVIRSLIREGYVVRNGKCDVRIPGHVNTDSGAM
jgi:hypothetical protein